MAYVTKPNSRIKKPPEYAVNTIIGPDSFVQGDIEASGFTRVDGSVKGNLHAQSMVVVGAGARMRSSITGTSVIIGGVVDGHILASERLVVLPTALIMGDIITRCIEVGEGCLIHGRIRVCQTEESWERAKSEYRDKRQTQRY